MKHYVQILIDSKKGFNVKSDEINVSVTEITKKKKNSF